MNSRWRPRRPDSGGGAGGLGIGGAGNDRVRPLKAVIHVFRHRLAARVAPAGYAVATMLQLAVADAGIRWLAARPALRPFFLRRHTKSFGRPLAPGVRPGIQET